MTKEIKILKYFVYFMYAVMIAGMLIIAQFFAKSNLNFGSCNIYPTELPYKVISVSLDKNKILFLSENQHILIYDLCSGRLLDDHKLEVISK